MIVWSILGYIILFAYWSFSIGVMLQIAEGDNAFSKLIAVIYAPIILTIVGAFFLGVVVTETNDRRGQIARSRV